MSIGLTNSHASIASRAVERQPAARAARVPLPFRLVRSAATGFRRAQSSGWIAAQTPSIAASTIRIGLPERIDLRRHGREDLRGYACSTAAPCRWRWRPRTNFICSGGISRVAVDEGLRSSSTRLARRREELGHRRDVLLVGHVGDELGRQLLVLALREHHECRPGRSPARRRRGRSAAVRCPT